MLHVLDLMEPEETIGNLWHDMASRWGQPGGDGTRAARLERFAFNLDCKASPIALKSKISGSER